MANTTEPSGGDAAVMSNYFDHFLVLVHILESDHLLLRNHAFALVFLHMSA